MAINGTLGSNINKDLRTATQFRHGAWRVLTFIIHVETDDIYTDFKLINQHMDFSDYPKNHECYNASNKKSSWENEG